jgi:hypothetical protein
VAWQDVFFIFDKIKFLVFCTNKIAGLSFARAVGEKYFSNWFQKV